MMENGKEYLTFEEFINASKQLEKLSENLQVNWKLQQEENSDHVASSFLKYVCHRPSHFDEPTNPHVDPSSKSTFDEECTLEEDDAKTELRSAKTDCVLRCEYHIVFNMSYSVPVIYFNISRPDGSLLTLDQIWSMFLGKKTKESSLNMDMWGTLTQQDHPLLHVPFFTLHPCHTSNVMGTLWNNSKNPPLSYLITWLSIIGGELGLSIANELGQHLVSCGDT